MSKKLAAPNGDLYARWLENAFKSVRTGRIKSLERAIGSLHAVGVPVPLNYDPLLERATGLPPVNFTEKVKVAAWMRP